MLNTSVRWFGLLLASAMLLAAQGPSSPAYEFWPGAQYDPAVPTIEKVTGHAPGERISSPAEILRFMEALAVYAPDRVKIFEIGKTFEGRRLIFAAIGTPERIAKLEELRQANLRLADPALSDTQAKQLVSTQPSFVWLAYGVHGNEISSSDAAMLVAYHLLAAKNDPMVSNILAHDLVLIDPLQNPDGRNRFVHNFEIAEGPAPDPDPFAAEHNEPWSSGRANHYYQDMNRDWFALTQPETRGRVKSLLEWLPQVYVDLHEMGANSTYYFSPEADAYNPHLTKDQKDELSWFGRNNAKYFDKFGFLYFTREEYDAFYPGYGAGWPNFYGAVGMTYEEASSRGLVMRRSDGSLLYYRDTVRHHFTTSLATLETAANRHDDLLMNFHKYRVTAVEEGRTEPIRAYLLSRDGDVTNADALARTLLEQGVEVRRLAGASQIEGHAAPAGSYVVITAQPLKRLVRTLLDQQVPMDEAFVKAEERRRLRKQASEIYDVTAWSLPLLYNVNSYTLKSVPANAQTISLDALPKGSFTGRSDAVYYLVPWNTNAAHFLSLALQRNIQLLTNDREFVQQGKTYPSGTLIISARGNAPQLEATLRQLSAETGADVVATEDSWVDSGPSFGSRHVFAVRQPKIVIAWDTPTFASSAGALRFVLERRYGYPVTVIRSQQLGASDLARYNVLILPSGGNYAGILGGAATKIKDWVASGGVLITVGNSIRFAADNRLGLLALSIEDALKEGEPATTKPASAGSTAAGGTSAAAAPSTAAASSTPAAGDGHVPGKAIASEDAYLRAIRPDSEPPDSAQGVLLKTRVDPDIWLSAGVPPTVHVLVEGNEIFSPLKRDKGLTAAYFGSPEEVLASGYLWDEYKKQVAFKPFAVVQPTGGGFTIGFTSDPTFRTYMRGLELLFLNAVFRGPAHARE
jgi:Zinc carboxypeptidase